MTPASVNPASGGAERLHRRLARAGVASRRAAEEMIRAGRVSVNGVVAALGPAANETHEARRLGCTHALRDGTVQALLTETQTGDQQ